MGFNVDFQSNLMPDNFFLPEQIVEKTTRWGVSPHRKPYEVSIFLLKSGSKWDQFDNDKD